MRLRFWDPDEGDNKDWEADDMPKMHFIQDRWPCFTAVTSAFNLEIQYLISAGTVYQAYTFTLKRPGAPPKIPALLVDANLLLRNLNFVNKDDENNHKINDTTHYVYAKSNDGYSVIAMHKVNQTDGSDKDAVALFISLFINGYPQDPKFAKDPYDEDNRGYFEIHPNQQASFNEGELKITLAYRLDFVNSATARGQPCPISYGDGDFMAVQKTLQNPFNITPFTEDEHLNFILGRNLEHILSVCSISIIEPVGNDSPSSQGALSNPEGPLIALTCGDISGHRIVASASL